MESKPMPVAQAEVIGFLTPTCRDEVDGAFNGQVFAWMNQAAMESIYKLGASTAYLRRIDGLTFSSRVGIGDVVTTFAVVEDRVSTQDGVVVSVDAHAIPTHSEERVLVARGTFVLSTSESDAQPQGHTSAGAKIVSIAGDEATSKN